MIEELRNHMDETTPKSSTAKSYYHPEGHRKEGEESVTKAQELGPPSRKKNQSNWDQGERAVRWELEPQRRYSCHWRCPMKQRVKEKCPGFPSTSTLFLLLNLPRSQRGRGLGKLSSLWYRACRRGQVIDLQTDKWLRVWGSFSNLWAHALLLQGPDGQEWLKARKKTLSSHVQNSSICWELDGFYYLKTVSLQWTLLLSGLSSIYRPDIIIIKIPIVFFLQK